MNDCRPQISVGLAGFSYVRPRLTRETRVKPERTQIMSLNAQKNSMPVLPNSKQELFAQAIATGKTADEAYALAGYRPNHGNAQRLKSNEVIRSRVEEIGSATA